MVPVSSVVAWCSYTGSRELQLAAEFARREVVRDGGDLALLHNGLSTRVSDEVLACAASCVPGAGVMW